METNPMFSRILLPLDGSPLAECVLPHAIALARVFGSNVTLLHVMDAVRASQWRRAVDPLNWQIRRRETENYLNEHKVRLQQAGLTPDIRILEGDDAEQIVEFARTDRTQLIMLSNHGQSGISEWNVSNTVQKITVRARTGFMIVRAGQPPPPAAGLLYRRLLVPVDGSTRTESILPVASALARAHQAHVVLAHVVHQPQMPRRTPATREDVELANRIVERNRSEATSYLGQLQSRFSGDVETRIVVSDHIAATLHELVEEEKCDLVLLSAHESSRRNHWFYGDVIASFVSFGTTPLFVMQDTRPEGAGATPTETISGAARG